MIKYVLFLFFVQTTIAQTVSTFFSDPSVIISDAMVFGPNGNLYGSDFSGDTVYKISPQGDATSFVTGLQNPNGLAFEGDNLYVAEFSGMRVNKYDIDGNLLESFPTGGFTSGIIKDVNGPGLIYTNLTNTSVNELALDGTITEIYQGSPLLDPVGLAFDDDGILYVANFTGRAIHKIEAGVATLVATIPDGDALGFITYARGMLYATNFGGHKIYSINPDGVDDITLYAGSTQGSDDGPIESATFDTTNGIIYDNTNDILYISEFSAEGNIRQINDAVLTVSSFEKDVTLNIFPNPTFEKVVIELGVNNIYGVTVFDMIGKKIIDKKLEPTHQTTLNTNNLANGMYLLKIETENGATITKKLLKRS